jgi:hypothetical protein
VKRRVFLLATLALVGVVAFAAGSVASAKPALAGSAAGATRASCYADAVGDAAPELGSYGWILVGLDTDRNTFTGGGRGDELLAFANGDGTTLTRWVDGRFTPIRPPPLRGVVFDGPRAGRGPRRIPGPPVQALRLRVTGSHPAGALERAAYPP